MDDETLVIIDSMITTGNEKVRDIVIYGESRLKEGQQIPIKTLREELLNSRRNLLNTRLFNEVELLIFKWTNENHVSIEFEVDERWYIYPLPVVELTGITFREWREEFDYDIERLTYGTSVQHNNLTGRGDRLNVDWRGGFQHQYKFNYFLPGIDKERNWGLGGGISFIRNKGTVIDAVNNQFDSELFNDFVFEGQGAQLSLSRRRDINKRHGLRVGFQRIEIGDTIQDLTPNFFVDGNEELAYGTLGYNLVFEKRDLSEYPTDGEFLFADLSYSGLFNNDFDQLRFTGNFNYYQPLSEKFFASAGVHMRYTPVYADAFNTLATSRASDLQLPRGYNDFQIFPISFGTIKSELRYRVLDKKFYKVPILPDRFKPVPLKIYPKIYLDGGQTFTADFDTQNPLNDEFLYSFGVGVDLVTIYNTPFLIEFGQNHFGETNLNFGIGKSF